MLNLIRISEAGNLAIHALAYLGALEAPGLVTTTEIAEHLQVSDAHLAKVLQRLTKEGFISSSRGPKGGFALIQKPSRISLMDVLEAIDGPFGSNTCLLGQPLCRPGSCMLKDLALIIKDYLSRKKISDFQMRDNPSRT